MVFHVPCHLRGEALESVMYDVMICRLLDVRPVLVLCLESEIRDRLETEGRDIKESGGQLQLDRGASELVKQEAGAAIADLEAVLGRVSIRSRRRSLSGEAGAFDNSLSVFSSAHLVRAVPKRATQESLRDSLEGTVRDIDVQAIRQRLEGGDIVIIPPLGMSIGGEVHYLHAEDLATEVAMRLQADKLFFFTRGQRIFDSRSRQWIKVMEKRDAQAFLECVQAPGASLAAHGEESADQMMRYLELIVKAMSAGARRGHLINATRGAVIQEVYTTDGNGTTISENLYEGIRLAEVSDIPGILKLIKPLIAKGLLKDRSVSDVERSCNDGELFVWVQDGDCTACVELHQFSDAPTVAELGCFVVSPAGRGKGRGQVLLSYVERVALLSGLRTLFLLTTSTMQYFVERGFQVATKADLPQSKQRVYDAGRSSRIYMKELDVLPTSLQDRFLAAEIGAL